MRLLNTLVTLALATNVMGSGWFSKAGRSRLKAN